MAKLLGGNVASAHKEYGPTNLRIIDFVDLFYGLPAQSRVFESHGDSVLTMPEGFMVLGSTESVMYAAVGNKEKKFYGVQFHPEVHHTNYGKVILKNFLTRICNLPLTVKRLDTKTMIDEIKQKVGTNTVIGAFSGG